MIFISLDIPKLSLLENTEIITALIHSVQGKLSWSRLVIIYMCIQVSEYPSHSLTFSLIYFYPPPPPYDIDDEHISSRNLKHGKNKVIKLYYLECCHKKHVKVNFFLIPPVKECNMRKLIKLLCLPLRKHYLDLLYVTSTMLYVDGLMQ